MNKNGITIKSYQDEHLNETLEFLEKWSPDHSELFNESNFKWQKCSRYLTFYKDKICGHIAQLNKDFKLNGELISVGWIATLVLDSSNPMVQVFSGTSLLNQVTGDNNKNMAAVGVVPEIESTHQRRGYVVNRESALMYAKFFKPSAALRFLNKSQIYSIPIFFINIFCKPKKLNDKSDIKEISSFESSWDNIWDKYLSEQYIFYGIRNAEYLNYKINQPGKSYKSFLYYDSDGKIKGYIIFRVAKNSIKNISLLKVCDLVGSQKARIELLNIAMKHAREYHVDGIISLSSRSDKKIFKKCGLWITRKYPVVLPPELNKSIHITFFESDLDHLW